MERPCVLFLCAHNAARSHIQSIHTEEEGQSAIQ